MSILNGADMTNCEVHIQVLYIYIYITYVHVYIFRKELMIKDLFCINYPWKNTSRVWSFEKKHFFLLLVFFQYVFVTIGLVLDSSLVY